MHSSQLRSLVKHQNIVYRVPGTRWQEALPMGDGCFGAMMYQDDGAFLWAINHLDVYMAFNTIEHPLPPDFDYRRFVREARAARRKPESLEAQVYTKILSSPVPERYGWLREGAWMDVAGQLRVQTTHSPLDAVEFEQVLNLYDASIETRCRWEQGELSLRSFVARNHRSLVVEVKASQPGLLKRLGVQRTLIPSSTAPVSGAKQGDFWLSDTLVPVNKAAPQTDRIDYTLYARVLDARGRPHTRLKPERTERSVDLPLSRGTREFTLLLTVALDEPAVSSKAAARRTIVAAHEQGVPAVRTDHERHWHGFWQKSQIELADRFLERLWYVNLYALACCDGTGMRFKAQATGLNGLWDVRNSCAWGSCWYWDVNIQQAYWGCYTANHLEMTQPFYDGLLEYVPAARRMAREFFGMHGIAGDFPHPFYNCIWPWCCQFFWWGYRYAMDEDFLREKAYPLMREVLRFFEDYLARDAQGRYVAFPCVSPEQGPLGQNTTILLSCLRYLLTAAIKANRRLGADPRDRVTWQDILRGLSPLPTGTSARYGETLRDSDWAPPDLWLGHPSLLMPIYPAGQIGPDSSARRQRIARNTLRYVEKNEAISTHNYGWLSAAAARLGLGDEAARILYENGVAYAVRPNGLLAEETDQWIDNCAVLSGPVNLPAMPEASGALLGALNEMLLQSRDGKVRVFPAVPASWDHARFEKLLAEGAWEVSAEYRAGKTRRVRLTALAGGTCRLVVNGKTVTVRLEAGETRELTFGGSCPAAPRRKADRRPPCYTARSQRRVFLGKTADTEIRRQLDEFLHPYYMGNVMIPRATKYKFDFGPVSRTKKDYAAVVPQQVFELAEGITEKMGMDFYRIHPDSGYTELRRFGWRKTNGLRAVDRRRPDALRRDFVCGDAPAEFAVDLPRGHYQVLCLLGDRGAETHMRIEARDRFRWQTRQPLLPGRFAVEVFDFRMDADGVCDFRFTGLGGRPWKLNALMLNRIP